MSGSFFWQLVFGVCLSFDLARLFQKESVMLNGALLIYFRLGYQSCPFPLFCYNFTAVAITRLPTPNEKIIYAIIKNTCKFHDIVIFFIIKSSGHLKDSWKRSRC